MALTAALVAVGVFGGAAIGKATSPKAATTGAAAPNAQPPALPPPPTITPQSQAQDALQVATAGTQQKKKIQAAVGRSDTILTGPNGLGSVAPQNSQTKTLLGL